jgi:hypothetical protein
MRDGAWWPCRAPCLTLLGASRSMTSPSPSVTVMIRPAADETTTRDGRPLAQARSRHVIRRRRTGFVCQVKSLVWQRLQLQVLYLGRDGVMASPPPPRRRWLLEGAGAAFQHVRSADSLHTVRYVDQSKHCLIRLRAWADSQAIGGGPRGRTRLRCKVITYMKNRVSLPLINSHSAVAGTPGTVTFA